MANQQLLNEIAQQVQNNDVVLYMKGTADIPVCGFSAAVVQILKNLDIPFKDVNILEDRQLHEAVKEYTDWPTIPQLYIRGEFIGGCDIVREMYEEGELQELLSGIKAA